MPQILKTIIFISASLANQSFTCQPVRGVPNAKVLQYLVSSVFNQNKEGDAIPATTQDRSVLDKIGVETLRKASASKEPMYEYPYNSDIGRIRKVTEIRNDVDSLITVFKWIEDCVSQNEISVDYLARFESNYVRTIRSSYSNSNWTIFCGDAASEKGKYAIIDDWPKSRAGSRIDEYFYNFIFRSSDEKVDEANPELHSCPKAFSDKKSEGLIDPFDVDKFIDLIHMFAVSSSFMSNQIIPDTLSFAKTLSSWGGDLQQEANRLGSTIVTDFEKILEEGDTLGTSLFPYSDLSADIDGQAMAYIYETSDDTTRSSFDKMSSRLEAYYGTIFNEQDRYDYFIKSSVHYGEATGEDNIYRGFQKLAFDMLDTTLLSSGKIIDGCAGGGVVSPIKYKILNGGEASEASKSRPTFECRKSLAVSFCDYILEKAGKSSYAFYARS